MMERSVDILAAKGAYIQSINSAKINMIHLEINNNNTNTFDRLLNILWKSHHQYIQVITSFYKSSVVTTRPLPVYFVEIVEMFRLMKHLLSVKITYSNQIGEQMFRFTYFVYWYLS